MSGAADRLTRLLALVPYLLARPGVRVEEVAAAFGVDSRKILDDLQLLFVCGLPGHLPDDLIEASFDGGVIHIANADTIARPLRLSSDEALALLIGLKTLADVPYVQGVDQVAGREALARTVAKLERAAGEAGAASEAVTVALAEESDVLPRVREAVQLGRRLHLSYYVARRDEVTERAVDPLRLDIVDGHAYLQAWCHAVEDTRIFRLDRVVDLRILDQSAAPPPEAAPRDLDDGIFQPSPDDVLVVLEVEQAARWVAEYYPCESVHELGGGRLRVGLRTPDTAWVQRLALRLGGEVTVVAPANLAAELAATARAALSAYA